MTDRIALSRRTLLTYGLAAVACPVCAGVVGNQSGARRKRARCALELRWRRRAGALGQPLDRLQGVRSRPRADADRHQGRDPRRARRRGAELQPDAAEDPQQRPHHPGQLRAGLATVINGEPSTCCSSTSITRASICCPARPSTSSCTSCTSRLPGGWPCSASSSSRAPRTRRWRRSGPPCQGSQRRTGRRRHHHAGRSAAGRSRLLPLSRLADHAALLRRRALDGVQGSRSKRRQGRSGNSPNCSR